MNRRMYTRLLLLILILCASVPAQARSPTPGREIGLVESWPVVVYTYRPEGCAEPKLLILFAGYHRDADKYRDRAIPLAKRACLLLFAPLLDRERFPNWRYQRAGVWRDGQVQPEREWSGKLLASLIGWARTWAGRSDMPYILFGHSAGAQFLSRIAAYAPPPSPARIIIANPSVHVMPSVDEAVPYGFAGVFADAMREAHLRRYLGLPITIYLGKEDTGDHLLVKDEGAMRQGRSRHERGLNVFRAAERLARQNSWPFNWRLVEVGDAGHSGRHMLDAAEFTAAAALEALDQRTLEPAN